MNVLSDIYITDRKSLGRGCNLSVSYLGFGVLLDARISLVLIVSTNNIRLLPADCFTKHGPSQALQKKTLYLLPCYLPTERYYMIIVFFASVGLGYW